MEAQQHDEQWLDEILESYYDYRCSQEGDGNIPPKNALPHEEAKQAILTELRKRIAIARHKDGEGYKNRLERVITEADQMARIEENESIRYVLAETIELGRDWCYNHDKYVSQCYACQAAKWTKVVARMYLQSIKERLAQLYEQKKSTPEK